MSIDQALLEVLDETVRALDDLDFEKLDALGRRIVLLAESNMTCERDGVGLLLSKRRQIEIILQNFHINLDVLTRLHNRNMRNQWAL